jgi:chemotaxis protein histidine kinase CheA
VGIDQFLCTVIKRFFTENVLDARALSSLNSTVKLLLQNRNWVSPDFPAWDDPIDYDREVEDREEDNENESDEEIEKTINQLQELAQEIQRDVQKREEQPQQEQPKESNTDQQPTQEQAEPQEPETSNTKLKDSEVNPSNPKSPEIQPDPKPKSGVSISTVPKFF